MSRFLCARGTVHGTVPENGEQPIYREVGSIIDRGDLLVSLALWSFVRLIWIGICCSSFGYEGARNLGPLRCFSVWRAKSEIWV